MTKTKYNELSKANIQKKRCVVISEVLEEVAGSYKQSGFTMAQQIEVDDGKKKMNVFLKNGFHVEDLSGLYNLRDALNVAIDKIEEMNSNDWDEHEDEDDWGNDTL